MLAIALAAAVSVFAPGSARAGEAGLLSEPKMSVVVEDGRLWAMFRNIPIEDAVLEISKQSGMTVEFRADLSSTVSTHFSGVPVIDALHEVLRGHSWANTFDDAGRISALYVYGPPRGAAENDAHSEPERARKPAPPAPDQTDEELDRAARKARLEEIMKLGREKPEGAAETLVSALEDDADPTVRWNAAIALADVPDRLAVRALVDKLMDYSEDPNVRRLAAWSLGRRRAQSAKWALYAGAADWNEMVRGAAQAALDAIERPPGGHSDAEYRRRRMSSTTR